MSKRFTETGKYDDPWYCDLSKDAKLAWEYVLAKCDACGVWEPNFKMATACLGKIDWKSVLSEFGSRVQVLKNGRWFVVKFVAFQYGKLSESCKPHLNVLRLLRQHGISLYPLVTLTQEYPKAIHSLQDKEEDKDKEKDSGSSGDEESREEEPKSEPVTPGMINNGEDATPAPEPPKKTRAEQAEEIYLAYPRREAKPTALRSIMKAMESHSFEFLLSSTKRFSIARAGQDQHFTPLPATWFNQQRFNDDPANWGAARSGGSHQTAADLKAANAHREHGLRPEDRPKVYNPMTDPDEF